jgi:hypothetical protein
MAKFYPWLRRRESRWLPLALLACSGFQWSACGSGAPVSSAGARVDVSSSARESGDSGSPQAGAAGLSDAGDAGDVVGSRDAGFCLGPGRYERSDGGAYTPCCDPLRYSEGPQSNHGPECEDVALLSYACLRGSCGDGICEQGEASTCGCTLDCPQATWPNSPGDEADGGAGEGKAEDAKVGFPESCAMKELAAYLDRSDCPRHCGDVALGASSADEAVAIACVRDAIADRKPFEVFWHAQGTDGLPHIGLLATWRGDRLHTIGVVVDEQPAVSLDITGAVASWSSCKLDVPERCDGPIDTCLSCKRENRVCGCLPAGRRPGLGPNPSDGATLEVRCEER